MRTATTPSTKGTAINEIAYDSTLVIAAADRIAGATAAHRPTEPIRDLIGSVDIRAAYAVQQELIARQREAGEIVVGRKIGLTSPAVQQQLGVDQPDFGVLFASMDVSGDQPVPMSRLLQPRAEGEIAFVLKSDLDGADLGDDDVRSAVDYAVSAIEIVDSRIADWNLRITDTVADNASGGLFVLGSQRLTLDDFSPHTVVMRMYSDGELLSTGNGAACLGDPLNALGWLARTAAQYGEPLRAGQVILSGALGPMIAVTAGATISVDITPLGSVSATFSEEDNS